jgi:hypothetical protein
MGLAGLLLGGALGAVKNGAPGWMAVGFVVLAALALAAAVVLLATRGP